MFLYWALFISACVGALGERNRTPGQRPSLSFVFLLFLIFIMISLRWRTGGDWGNYEQMVRTFGHRNLKSALLGRDPAFGLSLYLAARGWGGMLFIQTLSGAAVTAGLWAFCREQPRPWLALVVALPYFVIVVGMGYIVRRLQSRFSCLASRA